MLPGYDVLIRKVVEHGVPIFPEAICITEVERIAGAERGLKQESLERLKSSNKNKFYGQYLNDPMDDSLLEFKRDWFQKFDLVPGTQLANEFPVAPVLISIDPAFRMRQSNDDSGIVVTKTLSDNNVYILEAKGIKANPQMLVEEIFRLVDKYQFVDKILLETVTSQIMLMDLLQAEMRKRGLIPHYSNRRIYHMGSMYALEEQLIEFPRGQHDDIIDALAYQVKFWRPFNLQEAHLTAPHGSYEWWKKQSTKRPTVIGKLFRDIR